MWNDILYLSGIFFPIGYVIWFIYVLKLIYSALKESWELRDENLNNNAKKLAERMVNYKERNLEEQDAIFIVLKIKTQIYQYVGVTIAASGAVGGVFLSLAQEYLNSPVWGLWLIGVFIASCFMGHFMKVILDDFVYLKMIQAYRGVK